MIIDVHGSFFYRFLTKKEIMAPCIVHVTPELTKFISFSAWKMTKDVHMILQPISRAVFSELTTNGKDLCSKLKADFEKIVWNK